MGSYHARMFDGGDCRPNHRLVCRFCNQSPARCYCSSPIFDEVPVIKKITEGDNK